jgi:hypothetical protein
MPIGNSQGFRITEVGDVRQPDAIRSCPSQSHPTASGPSESASVQVILEWQDPGDEEFECVVIESPADCPRVLIRTLIPDMAIQPTETIEASKLVRVIDFGVLADLAPETVIRKHSDELTREQRLFSIEKFPAMTLEALGDRATEEEVDLCAQLHPAIALSHATAREPAWLSSFQPNPDFGRDFRDFPPV